MKKYLGIYDYTIPEIVNLNGIDYTRKMLLNAKRDAREGNVVKYKPFTLLHASDLHGVKEQLQRIVDYQKYYKQFIDDSIISGDVVLGTFDDDFTFFSDVDGAENIMLSVGNHDTAEAGSPIDWTAHVGQDSYEKFIKDFASIWGINEIVNKCYYYKDYADYAIRLIVVDCMENNSQEQLTWFENTLNGAKANEYAVVVVTHYSPARNELFECSFTSRQGYSVGDTLSSDFVAKVEDFIEGGGEFVCWLSGHEHNDFVGIVEGTTQLSITVGTASTLPAATIWSDTERIEGTKTWDLFNVVSVDTYQKIIKVLRVGANTDSWLRNKNAMVLQYASNSLYPLVNNKPILINCE